MKPFRRRWQTWQQRSGWPFGPIVTLLWVFLTPVAMYGLVTVGTLLGALMLGFGWQAYTAGLAFLVGIFILLIRWKTA